jgi:hypothetical protein
VTSLKPQYFIRAGVRRSVAAREVGLPDIPAKIVINGQPDTFTRLTLDQLHSPKTSILRDARYIRNTEYRTMVQKTEPPAIEVEPLGIDLADAMEILPSFMEAPTDDDLETIRFILQDYRNRYPDSREYVKFLDEYDVPERY